MRSADLTVSCEHFLSYLAGAQSCGLDLEPVLEGVGLSATALNDKDLRIPYSAVIATRLEICRLLDD